MDQIKQKLKLIDQQLTGPADLYRKTITTAPLLCGAIGLVAGILLQYCLDLPLWLWLAILAALAAACIYFFFGDRHARPQVLAVVGAICFVCLGAVRLTCYAQPAFNDISTLVADEPILANVRGLIITDPHVNKPRWVFARFKFTDPASSFYLKMSEVKTLNGWAEATGTVRVQVSEPVLDLQAGDHVEAYCQLARFKGPTNPGQFDTRGYLARKNILVAASIKTRDGISLLRSHSDKSFWKIRTSIRKRIATALLSDLDREQQSRGLIEALLLGHRQNINSETYIAFRRTGLLHFISLSGMHMGILVGIVWWLCKIAGFLKKFRAIICAVAVALFLLVVPPRAPTLRAAIICWIFCLSLLFRRKANPINTLSLAAIILLLIRPTQLFEAGWQLSFASVLGILLLSNRIFFFLADMTKLNLLSSVRKGRRSVIRVIISTSVQYVLKLFSVGLAAWAGGSGLLLYHFHQINPLASIWTVIAFPLVVLILTFGFLKMVFAFVLPTLAAGLASILTLLSDFLIEAVKVFSHLDISEIAVGRVPLILIFAYYVFVLFAFFVNLRRPVIKKVICTILALVLVASLGVTKWLGAHSSDLVLSALDVGHGQAILVSLPGGARILFDAGSLHRSDVGGRTVVPFMDSCGTNRLDAIVISHNDMDHISGIPEIVQACDVRGVYANAAFFSEEESAPRKLLADYLLERGHEIKSVSKGLNFNSHAKVEVIWPNERILKDPNFVENDKSLVSLIEFGAVRVLLCSDIEQPAQRTLLETYPDLKADIVIVPHHGSTATLDPDFLRGLDARILICSCGSGPYSEQKESLPHDAGHYFSTANDGAITCRITDEGSILIDTHASRRQTTILPR